MIDLHHAPTPNGWNVSIMLEQLGVPYKIIPVNIRGGEQFKPEFLAIKELSGHPRMSAFALTREEPALASLMLRPSRPPLRDGASG
jgi:hypothetical protein